MAGTIEQKEGRNVVEAVAELQARDYQMECWKAIDTSFQNGVWSQVGVLPTGSGKTFVFARLLTNAVPFIREWLNGFDARRQKVLIVAHREELLDQAARSLKEANPGLNVGIEQGERRASWMDDVVIASVQSLTASGGRRLRGLNPDEFRIVIVDEAHHAAAESYRTVLAYFQVVPPDGLLPGPKATEAEAQRARAACCEWWQTHQPDRLLLGVTATPSRGDAVGLEWTFRKVVYEQTLRWMIERAYLSPLVGYLVRTATSLDGVKITAGDFNQGQLAEKVNTPVRNRLAVEAWTARAAGRKTLAFTVDIQHAKDLAAAFQSAGVAAEWISGELRPDMRRQRLEDFRRGAIQVMTNCNVLTEGFDLPDVSAILMARPTRSQLLYCVDDATEILTPQGWARGGDIGDGSVVAAFDPKTTAIQWEAITAYTSRPIAAHERMMEMKTPALDLRVTDTHRMVYRVREGRSHIKSEWRIERAGRLSGEFELPVSGVQASGGVRLTDEEIEFVGWIQTDGCVNKTNGVAKISQAVTSTHVSDIERVLSACGFKWRYSETSKASSFGPRLTPLREYRVSRGAPRGEDKHLRGWGALEGFIPKAVGPRAFGALEAMDARQWAVFLSALHAGDGSKQAGQAWTRRSYHIASADTVFADWVQSMSVRRGWRCHLSKQTERLWMIHLSRGEARGVGKRHSRWRESASRDGEQVWCVSVPSGAIVVRRNGKTAIIGNTQMIGRGTRRADGKDDCVVLDVVDVSQRHSLVSIGDLFGLPPAFNFEGQAVVAAVQTIERWRDENPGLTILPGATMGSVEHSIEQIDLWVLKTCDVIEACAKMRWMEARAGRYQLPIPMQAVTGAAGGLTSDTADAQKTYKNRSGLLTIHEDMLGEWQVTYQDPAQNMAERTIGGAVGTVALAFDRAERWVERWFPYVAQMKDKDAIWTKRKASTKQIGFLRRVHAQVNFETLTRGEASMLIDQFLARKRS